VDFAIFFSFFCRLNKMQLSSTTIIFSFSFLLSSLLDATNNDEGQGDDVHQGEWLGDLKPQPNFVIYG
jgi:hypothetical protein